MLVGAAASFGARSVLLAIRNLAKNLSKVPGRKAVVLFSSGFPLTPERHSELAATVNACNKSNMAIYPIDVRGVFAPGGPGMTPAHGTLWQRLTRGVWRTRRDADWPVSPVNEAAEDQAFEELLDYIKRERGFDFTGYKRPSLTRRICPTEVDRTCSSRVGRGASARFATSPKPTLVRTRAATTAAASFHT